MRIWTCFARDVKAWGIVFPSVLPKLGEPRCISTVNACLVTRPQGCGKWAVLCISAGEKHFHVQWRVEVHVCMLDARQSWLGPSHERWVAAV